MKFERTAVWGFEGAFRGMRNALASWDKSDSGELANLMGFNFDTDDSMAKNYLRWYSDYNLNFKMGEKDKDLAQRLIKAGSPDRKFMRQIFVSVDITAPSFWVSELDTYKIGTTRNSCSLQHKGASRPFTIRDFSVEDDKIYEILDPPEKIKKEHKLIYPYETDEYKVYDMGDRSYNVYRNGRVVANPWVCSDTIGRNRNMSGHECKPSQYPETGYWYFNLGGRLQNEKWLLHRLVAETWMPTDDPNLEINHKDGNKGNNSLENLEWVTHSENEIHKHNNGLDGITINTLYKRYKASSKIEPYQKYEMKTDYKNGMMEIDIAKKYNISQSQVWAVLNDHHTSQYHELFDQCLIWEKIIDKLNYFRELYNETKDYKYFRIMRQLMPMGYLYKFTWTANYEVIRNIISQRIHHRLDEWSGFNDDSCNESFVSWAKTLPYADELLFHGLEDNG